MKRGHPSISINYKIYSLLRWYRGGDMARVKRDVEAGRQQRAQTRRFLGCYLDC